MKPAILVVDDDEVMRQTLSDVLTKRGYAVATAETGGQTLSYLKDQPFDHAQDTGFSLATHVTNYDGTAFACRTIMVGTSIKQPSSIRAPISFRLA